MTEFRIVTESELRPVLDTLNSLDWPVSFDDVPEVFQRLGWEQRRPKWGYTALPVSLKLVSFGNLRGEVSSIDFSVSDTLPGESAENKQLVKDAFPAAVQVVAACLGADPTSTPWVSPGARWELDGGRQLNLIQGEDTIMLQYWSKFWADVERDERRQGVDPAHTLDDRE